MNLGVARRLWVTGLPIGLPKNDQWPETCSTDVKGKTVLPQSSKIGSVVRPRGAMLDYIVHRDQNLMRRVNRWEAPHWVRLWMLYATRAGDGWLWYGIGLAILLFGGEDRFRAVLASALAEGIGVLLFLRVKRTAARRRPCVFEPHCWATLLPPDQFSFPSGHTITAFAVAVSMSIFYPHFAAALLFCAASVGASRIVLGMHFLSDVLAGAAVGSALAFGTTTLVRLLI